MSINISRNVFIRCDGCGNTAERMIKEGEEDGREMFLDWRHYTIGVTSKHRLGQADLCSTCWPKFESRYLRNARQD